MEKSPALNSMNSGKFSIGQLLLTMNRILALFVGFPQVSSAFILSEKGSPVAIVEGTTATQVLGAPGTIEITGWAGRV